LEVGGSLPAVRATRYVSTDGVAANRLDGMSGVTLLRGPRGDLENAAGEHVHMQIDGEYAGRLPGKVEIVPDALTLLTPEAY
jgi:diacylglycerol kinase family enzyme